MKLVQHNECLVGTVGTDDIDSHSVENVPMHS